MSRQESATEQATVRGEEGEGGPGLVYMPFVVMEDLLDKLKLLHYEQEFVAELKMRPLNRHYFVLQTNPGEQFFMFTSLAAWLIRKAGTRFDPPQETDDPNTTISNILEQLRKVGATIDFAPSKLKQGFGEHAIFVLDRLSDEALKAAQFHWSNPIPPTDELPQVLTQISSCEAYFTLSFTFFHFLQLLLIQDEEMEDDAELLLERVEEEMAEDYSEEEDGYNHLAIMMMMVMILRIMVMITVGG